MFGHWRGDLSKTLKVLGIGCDSFSRDDATQELDFAGASNT